MVARPAARASQQEQREPFRPVEEIVVPVEGTDREYLAQQWAVELASALGLGVRAIHVARPTAAARQDVFAYLQGECKKWGVGLEKKVLSGTDVVEQLVEELDARDLVVVGTRLLAKSYHVGSVAAELVRRAPCPVQIVRLA